MHRRVDSRLAVISVASFLLLAGVPRMSAAIGVDNDVIIDWGNCSARPRCGTAIVKGAPRTVDPITTTKLEIVVRIATGGGARGLLEVVAYDDRLRELCIGGETSCRASLPVEFSGNGTFPLSFPIELPGETAIVALKGHLTFPAAEPKVTIVVRSEGDAILADRIGDDDLNPGGAADIPPRSIAVMQALDSLEDGLFRKHSVELDAVGPRTGIVVGWTHAFLASDPGLQRRDVKTATLRLTLLSGDPCLSEDVILLDQAVNGTATGRRSRLPVIRLRDLQECPTVLLASGRYLFTIDLKKVPIRILSLDDLSLSDPNEENLTRDLEDGRLNVIVVGHSVVHDSALDITLKEK